MSNERRERFCSPWSPARPKSDPRWFRDGGRRGESLFACLNASRLGTAVRALVQAVLLLVPITAGAVDYPETGVTALVGATVIDGTGSKPFRDAVVLVSGERIGAVGPRGEIVIPEGARVVDMTGKWIIPGLVDAHIHLFQSGGLYTRPDVIDLRSVRPYAAEVDWLRARLPMTLARYLASGVTAVLDVGGPFWTFEARERSKTMPYAPQLSLTGPLISSHMPSELRVADPPILEVNAPAEARAAVRRILAQGPDLIKLWWIPEASRSLGEQSRWVRAAIGEGHRAGVRVAVHATQLEVARAAVLAGADVLVHSVDDRRVDDGFVRLLKERDVVYVTTLGVNEGYREVFEQRFKPTDLERRLGDAEVLATLDDLADLSLWKGAFWKRWLLRWPDPGIAFWNLRRLHEAGITVAAGSDAGNIGTLHGPALHRELERMAEAGLAPLEILGAATQGGARAMGRASELGTVEPGKRADLLVLDADPQSDIRHVRRIYRVLRGGAILNPEQIAKAASGNQFPRAPRTPGGSSATLMVRRIPRLAPISRCPPTPTYTANTRILPATGPGIALVSRRSSGSGPDADQWEDCRTYLYGMDLFNRGYYWGKRTRLGRGVGTRCGRSGKIADVLKGLIAWPPRGSSSGRAASAVCASMRRARMKRSCWNRGHRCSTITDCWLRCAGSVCPSSTGSRPLS